MTIHQMRNVMQSLISLFTKKLYRKKRTARQLSSGILSILRSMKFTPVSRHLYGTILFLIKNPIRFIIELKSCGIEIRWISVTKKLGMSTNFCDKILLFYFIYHNGLLLVSRMQHKTTKATEVALCCAPERS